MNKIRVACCGDSITYGTKATSLEYSYPACLQNILGDKFEVGNLGHAGATAIYDFDWDANLEAPYCKLPIFQKAKEFEPNVTVLMLGMNDANPRHRFTVGNDGYLTDYYLSHYEQSLCDMIDDFRNLPSEPAVYIAETTPMCRSEWADFDAHYISRFNRNLDLIRKIQRAVAYKKRCFFIDTCSALRKPQDFSDGCHLTDCGYRKLAVTIASAIEAGRFYETNKD